MASCWSDSDTEDEMMGLRSSLLNALDAIETPAAFASSGEIGFVDPGVFVHGMGPIYLPLEESQARQMIEQAHQAPYGKGSETIIDTSVRNTWELHSGQFELRRPSWNTLLERVVAGVARELDLDSTVHAELYKMLIYEEGAMFKPHTDTEKAPGMVATLVIGLPSAHEGGEVVVNHRGQQKTFKLSNTQCSYASWYSDVVHEVLPVTSGYRWVLTYNLALDASQPRPAGGLQPPDNSYLYKTLKLWVEQDASLGPTSHFWYQLDHEYTEASISLRALKTRDLACVQALYEISTMLPVDIFLAVLEKTEHGTCDYDDDDRYHPYDAMYTEGFHPLEDVTSTTYEVKSLVDLDGKKVLRGRTLDTKSILQADCFEDISPEESYRGYLGNEGPDVTHWYRVTAVAVVARCSTASFLLGGLPKK
ncbi:2OG-Fe(II) oxygenase [Aspergillus fijiensis CBS 313.89]|uniref:Fe2OG dioxygenase domain-containing protein n=1 Tax=Aspergillus fijiensis CBS 313.89 TaxID=1448319 RepID=A0A8G1RS99_9EURO|nr:uncharacterized protein BO72DRAFT_446121 [Aspergillus fijiensis CBS 313.89]RAK79282.1 hypothetical protein BO72DRAFT_446121 [Aspergillus fijiensis CBS 313.89]